MASPRPRTTFELGLEGLEDLLHDLRAHAWPGIGKGKLPVGAKLFNANRKGPAFFHSAHGVLAKIPEHLLHAVAIGQSDGLLRRVAPLNMDAGILRLQAVFQQR